MIEFEKDLFQCQKGVHGFTPSDPLDPAGTACGCGAVTMIGVMAAVKGERKVFLRYLIDTTESEADAEVDEFTIDRLKSESVYE